MIILLHGSDTFRSQQKRNELIAAYRNKYAGGLSESSFSGADFSLRDLEEHVRGQGLFSAKRLILLSDFAHNKPALHDLEECFKKNDIPKRNDVFVLVWEDVDVAKLKEASFLAKNASLAQVFPVLTGSTYRSWLATQSKQMGIRFDKIALEEFVSWREGDAWGSIRDMQKLHSYAGGGVIQTSDVEKLCIKPFAPSIFRTLEILFAKKDKEVFAALEQHVENGEEPLYLFSMFAYQLRLIALVKDRIDAGQTSLVLPGMHPFVLRKTIPLARSISWEKLNKLFGLLYRFDAAIKQGTADSRLCLAMFAYDVACLR